MAIDTNTLKEHFSNKAIPTDTDFSNLIDLAATGQNAVADNKDGTEQLNGVQVRPFNKLSDTIGGRNLLINTAQLNDSTVCLDTESNISDTYLGLNIYQANTAWSGVRIYWSYLAPKIKTNTNYVMNEYVRNTSPTTSASIGIYGSTPHGGDSGVVYNSSIDIYSLVVLPPNSGWTRISAPVNIASFPEIIGGKLRFENVTDLTDGYVQFAGLKFEQGSVATDWSPAPEDKVNVSDMRKPANDVAGIEEVSAKQDKIGYTPADDSKVVHNSSIFPSVMVKHILTADDDVLALDPGTYYLWGATPKNYPDIAQWGLVVVNLFSVDDANTSNKFVEVFDTFGHQMINIYSGTPIKWSGWKVPNADKMASKSDVTSAINAAIANKANDSDVLHLSTGDTASRPTGISTGYQYFDISLNKPIWYTGKNWVDSTGTTV